MQKFLGGGGKTLNYLLAGVIALAVNGAWAARHYLFIGSDADAYWQTPRNWALTTSPNDPLSNLPGADNHFWITNVANFAENPVIHINDDFKVENNDAVNRIHVCDIGSKDKPVVFRADRSEIGLVAGRRTQNDSGFWIGLNGSAWLQLEKGRYKAGYTKGTWYLGSNDTKYQGHVIVEKEASIESQMNFNVRNGSLTINGGNVLVSGGYLYVGNNGGTAALNINGGKLRVDKNDGYITIGANSSGIVNLNGGRLETTYIHQNDNGLALNFNGGTLARVTTANSWINGNGFINSAIPVTVGEKGGTIDTCGDTFNINASFSGQGALRFTGGGTATLKGSCALTGGTIVELGTKLVVASEVARDAILAKGLKVEYGKVLDDGDYTVFEYSGGLPEDALSNVELVNCGVETTIGFNNDENPTAIVVKFVAPEWISDTASTRVWTGTLDDVAFGKFTARFGGKSCTFNDYAHPNAVNGYNKKVFVSYSGSVTNVVAEYQVKEDGTIKCVIVSFTNGVDGVYATAVDAKYVSSKSYAGEFEFYKKDYSWAKNISDYNIVLENGVHGYGVYDLRVTTEATAKIEQEAGDKLKLSGTGDVGQLVLPSKVLEIASESKIASDNFYGESRIVNHGTVDFKGKREYSIPFDNASTGMYVVSNGILYAQSVAGTGQDLQIVVASGAKYDINAKAVTASVVLEDVAEFANGADAVHWNTAQTRSLKLNGNAKAIATHNFGLVAKEKDGGKYVDTSLDLGDNILTLTGDNNFILNKTTVTGGGKVVVDSGVLVAVNGTHGDYWAVKVNMKGTLWIYTPKNTEPTTLTVGDFVNEGTIKSDTTAADGTTGTLVVKGVLTPGNSIPKLQLADGAIVKVVKGKTQEVTSAFSALGTVKIDASDAASEDMIGKGVSVLKVPSEQLSSDVNWEVVNAPVSNPSAKWVKGGDGYSTLKIRKTPALFIRVR